MIVLPAKGVVPIVVVAARTSRVIWIVVSTSIAIAILHKIGIVAASIYDPESTAASISIEVPLRMPAPTYSSTSSADAVVHGSGK